MEIQQTDCLNMWQRVVLFIFIQLAPSSWTLSLKQALDHAYQEQHFNTLLLLQHPAQDECNQLEQVTASWPMLRFDTQANVQLRQTRNTEMLAMICLSGNGKINMDLWQALAGNLYNMRHVRVLMWQEEPHLVIFKNLAEMAQQLQFHHVVLLSSSGEAYRLQPYAEQNWLRIDLQENSSIFASKFNFNMLNSSTLPDQITSMSLVYRDKRTNELRMTGFVARLIQEFARLYNVSLHWQRKVIAGEQLSSILLRNMTLNGTLNLPMTLCGYELPNEEGIYSYPYDIPSWFITVPCAREVATAKVYVLLFGPRMLALLFASYGIFVLLDACLSFLLIKKKFDWTYLMFNERMISGIIGQSSKLSTQKTLSSHFTQAQLFIVGLMISTLFSAHLNTMLTKRPRDREISNLEELRESKIDIVFEAGERLYMDRIGSKYPIFYLKSSIKYLEANKFYTERSNLNTSQGFSITSTEWNIIKRQQELFHQPAYCYHTDLVFRTTLLMSVPLKANSIFIEPLNQLIHQVHASGLLIHWKQESLRDLITLGQISVKDPYPYEPFQEFKVGDLFWVWLMLVFGLLLALTTFILELIVYRVHGKALQKITNSTY